MILREPTYKDCEFIADCYYDWPDSQRGRVFPVDVRDWIKSYRKTSNHEFGLIGETGGYPVGFVLYGQNFFAAKVYEIVVHQSYRGLGHGSAMWRALKEKMVSEGVVVASFEAIPGVVADLTVKGKFQKTGEGVGEHTGLPLVKGQVTWDMDI